MHPAFSARNGFWVDVMKREKRRPFTFLGRERELILYLDRSKGHLRTKSVAVQVENTVLRVIWKKTLFKSMLEFNIKITFPTTSQKYI